MKTEIIIRKFVDSDAAQAGALMEEMWSLHADSARLVDRQKIMSVTGPKYIQELVKDQQASILIALTENRVVGVMSCNIQPLPKYYRYDRQLYLDDLCVAQDMRGQGIAGELIKAAEKLARNQKIPIMAGKIWSFNDTSKATFKKQSFEPDYELWHKLL